MLSDYITHSAYQIGISHISKGLGCEDFSADYIDENIAIAVISDGHGDKNCFRSAKGAELACTVAIDIVKGMFTDSEALASIRLSPDRVITELEKAIIYNWNLRVSDDIRCNPFTDNEYEGLDENVVITLKSGQKHQKVYGCTLIMCVFLEDFWFGIQIGDGKCVICTNNGMYSQPIPWDNEGCVGNRSTSICNSNAFESFRYFYGSDVPVAAFVASDGIDESFDENGLNKCYFTIATWLKTLPEEEYSKNLDELLGKISKGGSGDDVSVACIVNKKAEIKKPYATSTQVAEKMEELFSILKDAEKRYVELIEKRKETSECKNKLEKEIDNLQKLLEDKKTILEDKSCEMDSLDRNIDNISKQLQMLSEQFNNAKKTKMKVDEYWLQLGEGISDNSEVMNYQPMKLDENNTYEESQEVEDSNNVVKEVKKTGFFGNLFKK